MSLFWPNEIGVYSLTAFLCLCEASVAPEKCPTSSEISGDILGINEENLGCDVDSARERGEGKKKKEKKKEKKNPA